MNDGAPPPIPPDAPSSQPQSPPHVNMAPRWILWVIASAVLPALPWLVFSEKSNDAGTVVVVLTVFALIMQLAASISVAVGFCRRRLIGVGGVIGMTLVFMLASVAIGSPMWFATCAARASLDFK